MIGLGSAALAYIAFCAILILQISSNPGLYYSGDYLTSAVFFQDIALATVGILLIVFGVRRIRKSSNA